MEQARAGSTAEHHQRAHNLLTRRLVLLHTLGSSLVLLPAHPLQAEITQRVTTFDAVAMRSYGHLPMP